MNGSSVTGYHKISEVAGKDSDLTVRRLLSEAITNSGKRREEIARQLSERVGRTVKVATLNDYTRTTRTAARFPAAYIPHFCEITGDDCLREFLLGTKLRDLVTLGRIEVSSAKSAADKRAALGRLLTTQDEGRN